MLPSLHLTAGSLISCCPHSSPTNLFEPLPLPVPIPPSLQDAQRAAKAAGPGYEPLALMVPLKASEAAVLVA